MNTADSVSIGLPAEPRRYRNFIDGTWSDAADGATVTRMSPAHDVPVGIYPRGTVADADRAVAAARRAFDDGRWSDLGGAGRATVLLEAARLIRARRDELALIETLESGKPITQSRGEVDGAVSCFEYAAGHRRRRRRQINQALGLLCANTRPLHIATFRMLKRQEPRP